MDMNTALKKRINELAEEHHLSIQELNIKAGLNYNTINKLNERKGNRPKTLTIVSIEKICRALEITLSSFFSSEYFRHMENRKEADLEKEVKVRTGRKRKKKNGK